MRSYKTLNNIFGWVAFAIAAFTYLSTMESTTSLWDCPEFITSGDMLEVGHPPGAPLFMLLMRFFTMFTPLGFDAAVLANSLSALASAFTILFLFWSISHLARKLINKKTDNYNLGDYIAVLGSAMVGALAYTFSDTFWFSAVEAEVYATSSLFTAVVFWAILKWEECADEKYANRWLILLAYVVGLSIGVHLLNLLAIPAIVFVYYFRKYPVTKWGIIKTAIFSIALLGFFIWVFIPGIPKMATWFELPFVNDLGLPINSGAIFYILILAILLGSAIYYTISQKKLYAKLVIMCVSVFVLMFLWSVVSSYLPFGTFCIIILFIAGLWYLISFHIKKGALALINTIVLCFTVAVLGYSSYALIIIRSSANPSMDQNNPDNIVALISYLNRDQYGNRPLLTGQYYNAPAKKVTEELQYVYVNGKYEKAAYKKDVIWDSRYTTIFPRMFSSAEDKVSVYKGYVKGRIVPGEKGEQAVVPTFADNLRFLFDYQIGFMYWRYFMWNFAGRQNDLQATKGDPTRGNWISGIKFLDENRLGPQENQPLYMTTNKAHNAYYLLPLLLGLIGLGYQVLRDKRNFTVVMLLFFLTGIAIVLYLNQTPNEPRERDYAYAGSFYAFAIWIGLGVMALYKMLKKVTPSAAAAGLVTTASLAVPVIMCEQNWDDHNRHGRYIATDSGKNYLNSCDENSIVFVFGDNDTFPLWYSQEVEGVRKDVRVANAMYLHSDWYYGQKMRKINDSEKFITTATLDKIAGNRRDETPVFEDPKIKSMDAGRALKDVMDDSKKLDINVTVLGENKINAFRTKILTIPIDKQKVIADGYVNETDSTFIPPALAVTLPSSVVKSNLAILDIVTNNFPQRPIYFGITLPAQEYQMGLGNNLQLEGLAYKLVPLNSKQANKTVNIEKTFDLLVNKFIYRGTNDPNIHMDETANRQLSFYRRAFIELGEALAYEGQIDSLRLMLKKYEEVLPIVIDPLWSANSLVALYLAANETQKASDLISQLCKEYEKEIDYFWNLRLYNFEMSTEITRSFYGLSNLRAIVANSQNKELTKVVENSIEKYRPLFEK